MKNLACRLYSRGMILDELALIPQPITTEEKQALTQLNKKYKRLLANFKAAIEQLNIYLKQSKSA